MTNQDFLIRHCFLAELGSSEVLRGLFSSISPMSQFRLHRYYQKVNTGSDEELLSTRFTSAAEGGALPQKAGWAYKVLVRNYCRAAERLAVPVDENDLAGAISAISKARLVVVTPGSGLSVGKRGAHRVQGLAQPETDLQHLAKVLVTLAKYQQTQRADEENSVKDRR